MKLSPRSRMSSAKIIISAIAILLGFASGACAQSLQPFAGTWIWNAKESRLTAQKLSIQAAGANSFGFDDHDGEPFTVVADGKPHALPGGDLVTLKQSDAGTWESSRKGAVSSVGSWKLDAGGKTLERRQAITWADGGKEDRVTDYQRLGSGQGLTGEWESKTFESKTATKPFELLMSTDSNGSLLVKLPAYKSEYRYMLDGKDYPDTNAGVPKGMSLASSREGPNAIHAEFKLNGALVSSAEFKLSPDGRTMTVRESHKGQSEPIIYKMDKR